MFKRLKAVLVGINLLKMSNSEFDRADKTIRLALNIMLTLLAFACSVIFYSLWNNVGDIKADIGGRDGINVRLKSLEDKVEAIQNSIDKK